MPKEKEFDVRIVDHGDGTFSVSQAFKRNMDGTGFVPIGTGVIVNILRKHFQNEVE